LVQPLAVALGDPSGIGPEIVAKAWERRDAEAIPPFFAVGDLDAMRAIWSGPVEVIDEPSQAAGLFSAGLPLVRVANRGTAIPGEPDLDGARNALDALEIAVGLTRSGAAGALVTGPVSKRQLYAVGFVHAGQTEFVAERCGVAGEMVAMMLAGPDLRTVPVTVHLALAEVPEALTTDRIVAKARATVRGLQRQFGIAEPRIAVAGLNPHAGEGGAMGREELDRIVPAIEILKGEGLDVSGPRSADTLFHAEARRGYDAALCMYHDQALIPIKTLYFDAGVNMTLGLPIVRTSPDHGTAFDLAGKDRANPGAMIAALKTAGACGSRIAGSG
jgi:4-hydroxythreonine-4-phosphate dehydrogenase